MTILVTGASGALGRRVASQAVDAGFDVRGLSRRVRWSPPPAWQWYRGDLASGDGVSSAIEQVDAVVHAASDPRRPQAVDIAGTTRLIAAARHARVHHLVYVSIVGVDAIPYCYYRRKLEAEQLVESSGVPFTIVRATQFHSFIDAIFTALARVPFVLPLPRGFKVQSVAVEEVAARVLRAVAQGPLNRTVEIGGPDVLPLDEMADLWLAARGIQKRRLSIPVPGAVSRAFIAGKNTAPAAERANVRWRDWLADVHPRDYRV